MIPVYGRDNFNALVEKIQEELDLRLGEDTWEFKVRDQVNYDFSEKLPLGEYKLTIPTDLAMLEEDVTVASFKLLPMPGCCGICISTQAYVNPKYQGKGLGTLMNSLRVDIARHNGYGVMLCTDVEGNTPQRKILAKNGWMDVHKFVNPRTRNTIFISVINL